MPCDGVPHRRAHIACLWLGGIFASALIASLGETGKAVTHNMRKLSDLLGVALRLARGSLGAHPLDNGTGLPFVMRTRV